VKNYLQLQIEAAFDAAPGLDGIIHGIRKIKQGKHGSRSSLFFSRKNECFIPVESRLERTFCYHMEADPLISKYRGQALEIPFRKSCLYPDFLILKQTGQFLVCEVKASVFVDDSNNTEKFNFLEGILYSIGVEFDVMTEKKMLSGQEKLNLMMTYNRGGRLIAPDYVSEWPAELFGQLNASYLTVKVLREEMVRRAIPAYQLEGAIFHGKLLCNMRLPITSTTLVRLP
jgi:hypothetical protein